MPADRKKSRRGLRPLESTTPELSQSLVTDQGAGKQIDYESLARDDLDCPICIDLVNEPVRLKCDHLLCRECFERLLELSSRKCPKCRRWIGGRRRISEWLDHKLWEFIRKKFLSPPQVVNEQIKADHKLAMSIARQQRRESWFRRSHYTLRSSAISRLDTSVSEMSTMSSSAASTLPEDESPMSPFSNNE